MIFKEILCPSQGMTGKGLEQHKSSFPFPIHFCWWITLAKPKWKQEDKDQTDVIPESLSVGQEQEGKEKTLNKQIVHRFFF